MRRPPRRRRRKRFPCQRCFLYYQCLRYPSQRGSCEPPVWIRSATINRNATISRIKLVFSSFSSERLFCSCNCTIWSFALPSLVSKYVISFKRFSEVSLQRPNLLLQRPYLLFMLDFVLKSLRFKVLRHLQQAVKQVEPASSIAAVCV